MSYKFISMNERYAGEIVENWHYSDIYSFYDMSADEEDLAIFLDKSYWKNNTYAVLNDDEELAGWVTFYPEDDTVWLSLGLKPALTGIGLGEEYVSACIEYAKSKPEFKKKYMKLDVAVFNERALKVYKRAGFAESEKFLNKTHIGEIDFIRMTRIL